MTVAEFTAKAGLQLAKAYEPRERENVIRLVFEETLSISAHQLKRAQSDTINADAENRLENIVQRLSQNEPVQYVLGFADFYGLRLKVNRSVLIPRPETEELVAIVVKTFSETAQRQPLSILDIGTGTGCIAIALKKNMPDCQITAMDASSEAIAVAEENARSLNCRVNFIMQDFLNESGWRNLDFFDVVISNPPYVTREEFSELSPRVKNFEPTEALIADGNDPFVFYRQIAVFGKMRLMRAGKIFLELNSAHAHQITSIFQSDGYTTSIIKDLQGLDRMLVAGLR